MKFRRFETPGIAHYAYLIADEEVAAIVDPCRHVEPYLEAARELGVRIDYVIETHRHEDFVMGSTELAERVGAEVVNGRHDCFGRGDRRLADRERLRVGELEILALHTPGHTPESMSWAVFDPAGSDQAWGVFTGDALFFGETGRTDLPDPDAAVDNAGLLWDSVHEKIAPLGDGALIFPAHGPGSVCGSGMASWPASTLGLERRRNPVFTKDREDFARAKGGERIPRPPYFRRMEELNSRGGALPKLRPGELALLSPEQLAERPEGSALIDTREPEAFAGGHVPGAYSVWMGGLPIFGGWVSAGVDEGVYLCTKSGAEIDEAALHLSRIGVDELRGALRGGFSTWRSSAQPLAKAGTIAPRELAERRDEFTIIDVREADEFAGGHIPGAVNVYVGELEGQLDGLHLDPRKGVVVTCGVGHRASLAASVLRREGFPEVYNLLGGMAAWRRLDLALERPAS